MEGLEQFIVRAKARTYVGNGSPRPPCRLQSHDVGYDEGDWTYLDSYFGGTDFHGQEIVWLRGDAVWAMSYYGRILEPALIDAEKAGRVIKQALSAMYAEGRFLGGYVWTAAEGRYVDCSEGAVESFNGTETIAVGETVAYRLDYFGGLILP